MEGLKRWEEQVRWTALETLTGSRAEVVAIRAVCWLERPTQQQVAQGNLGVDGCHGTEDGKHVCDHAVGGVAVDTNATLDDGDTGRE